MHKKYKFGFLGTGAYGSAIANVLTSNKIEVIMYGIDEQEISDINQGFNTKYFKDHSFKNKHLIKATNNLEEVIDNCEAILLAVPSFAINEVLEKMLTLRPRLKFNLINIAKGFEKTTKMFFSEFIKQKMKNNLSNLATILGPSFAQELFLGSNTIVNVISDSQKYAKYLASQFNNKYFKLVIGEDSFASELFAALKNVLAIGAGILYTLNNSRNAQAAFLTTGLKEIMEIYKLIARTKKYKSIFDYSTFGDILLTCTSEKSRNYSYGKAIALHGLNEANKIFKGTIEGKEAATVVLEIINAFKVDFVVFKLIIGILSGKLNPKNINKFIN